MAKSLPKSLLLLALARVADASRSSVSMNEDAPTGGAQMLQKLESRIHTHSEAQKPPCVGHATIFDFEHATIADNNLGGQGPAADASLSMRFNNVGLLPGGDPFDMTVTILNDPDDPYVASNSYLNGLRGKSGQVNVNAEKSARMKFSMVQKDADGTDKPVVLDAFYFSVYDIDQNGYMSEEVIVGGYDEMTVPEDAEYTVTPTGDGQQSLTSLKFGRICDNPKEPTNLHIINCYGTDEVDQRRRAVTMLFQQKDSFEMTFKVHLTRDVNPTNQGRQLLFGGPTSLIEPCHAGPAVIPETTTTTTTTTHGCVPGVVEFNFEHAEVTHRNLGGVGPDKGPEHLMYKGIGKFNGNPFDMKVVVHNADYKAGKPKKTGLEGKSGQINVKVDSQANMTFSFIDDADGSPVTLPAFYISIFDIDWGPAADEVVMVKGYEEIVIPTDHEYDVCDGPASDGKTFTSTMPGNACDNPPDPENLGIITCKDLTVDTEKRSFSMLFKEKSSFDITFVVPGKEGKTPFKTAGRNMQFAGSCGISDPCS